MAGRNRTIVTVDASHEGSRLDKVVQSVVPDVGLREARRMIREGLVRVDGLPGAKGDRMRQGQQLEIREPLTGRSPETFTIVTVQAGLAALEKPAGVHSQSLGRTRDLGVDASLAALFPGQDPVLLNRLDKDTSGLLIAALTREAETTWHVSQNKGEIEKFYLTLVRGRLAEPVAIKNQINSAHRSKVKVLEENNPDKRRWTLVYPFPMASEPDRTLCLVRILKGGRHQIRAHMASCGHPVVGDPLYGTRAEGGLRLHHFHVRLPGFEAMCWPGWIDSSSEEKREPIATTVRDLNWETTFG